MNETQIMRPLPAHSLSEPGYFAEFIPAPEVTDWLEKTILNPDSPLFNEDHAHLLSANIKVLWTNSENNTKQVLVAGQAEIPRPPAGVGKWARARWKFQMIQWFGPDFESINFLITLYAPYVFSCSDVDWCALIDHELYHCAQALDEFGSPKYRKDGSPTYAIKDHDFSGFIGVGRRYGPVERGVQELVDVLSREPEIAVADVSQLCGTCLKAAK